MTPPDAAPDFLASAGWAGAAIEPVAGDASLRRYFRAVLPGRTAILMDSPPAKGEDPRPFVQVARWLSDRGFAAPAILHEDLDAGLLLLEDFGSERMRETVDGEPHREQELYAAAVDLLVRLHAHEAAPLGAYDLDVYHREAALFPDWYCRETGLDVDAGGYRAAWEKVLAPVADGHVPVTVLRDYHAENIMLIRDQNLGLLDFQDALAGHRAYDLVSLLQDARRDVPAAIEAAMLERYRSATGADAAFDTAYHVLGAQRNAKIIGIFTRLWKRDGKPRYPTLCPRVWTYLERDLAHPALAPVKAWFDSNVPAEHRGDPKAILGE
ncbi:aminoglycoside phosphotransferase family protein [Sphingomonas canadensis]|uniref:Aminoglycoside phosphotransferase family protein n=1 Tax=Sphingomonas canadensis TaxID=1219257 RepID=A0ABW3H9K8_9SPHN|nr:phosphotransferase [Sphingomonas canadensis]MCW3837871.1 phosphotransferase [Sphingomonas canadensis]